MYRLFSRLKNNDSGSIAIIIAGVVIVLLLAGGGSVDVWRANEERSALQNSLDAAILHAARISITDETKVEKALNDYMASVAKRHKNLGNVKIEYKLAEKNDTNVIQAWATGQIENRFLGFTAMLGFDSLQKMDVSVYSEVARGGSPVEIALVLDVTGSMKDHMDDLKDAAEELVDIVFDMDNSKNNRVQVALVPYVGTVNILPKGSNVADFMKYMDKNGDSKYHGKTLENNYLGRKDTEECKPKPSGGGGGGGGGGKPHDPTTGGSGSDADASKYIPNFDGSSRAGRILAELFGIQSAHAATPYTPHNTWDPCLLWNPDKINHFTLFDLINNVTWKGCVESRPEPYDITDDAPTSGNADTLFVPWFWLDNGDKIANWQSEQVNDYITDEPFSDTEFKFTYNGNTYKTGSWERTQIIMKYNNRAADKDEKGPVTKGPNKACPDPIVPLQKSKGNITSALKNLDYYEGSGTNSTIGLAWGWRVLSPGEPFTEGSPYGEKKKIIVLMTDGKNNAILDEADHRFLSHYFSYGYFKDHRTGAKDFNEYSDYVNSRFSKLCTNIKNSGDPKNEDVVIFTITFGVSDTKIQQLYEDCASRPPFAYNADTAGELKEAFTTIANMISQLYLTQ